MIILTRLNGEKFAINSDLVERVDSTPDTVITLVDATKYLVIESLAQVVDQVRDFRASVLVRAQTMQPHEIPSASAAAARSAAVPGNLRIVTDSGEDL
jgi:flagellar protein FlbD